MSQLGGGLRWSGVTGGSASTASSRIMKAAKSLRQKEAMAAPKVGSACVVEADDWLAAAAANQERRERAGATGNPFASAEAVVKEAKRQAVDEDDEFAIPAKRARAEEEEEDDDDDAAAAAGGGAADDAADVAPAVELSHEEKREIELSVFELRDELEEEGVDDDEIEEKAARLRATLLAKACAAKAAAA
jgi:hypothetical protein